MKKNTIGKNTTKVQKSLTGFLRGFHLFKKYRLYLNSPVILYEGFSPYFLTY